jgi:thioredoxin-like negative regulator of GroEL
MVTVVAEAALENRNTFAVAKMNIAQSRQTHQKYRVIGHPTYIVFQDGETVGRFSRPMPKNQFVQKILNAINN